MLDPSIVEDIIASWKADEAHPHRGRRQRDLPSSAVLQKMLDAAFLTTLRDEEGRLVPFSAVLLNEEEAKEPYQLSVFPPLTLATPIPFSPATTPKIAAAFAPELSTLAVKWDETRSELVVWAVFFHSPPLNRFTEVPVGVPGNATTRPDFLTLMSRGRGALAVARGTTMIGTFQAGVFVPATPTPFTASSLGGHLYSLLSRSSVTEEHHALYWQHVRDAMDVLLAEAARRGHGGTIVILPAGCTTAAALYRPNHVPQGSFRLQATLDECVRKSGDILCGVAYRKVALECLQRIAQLSAVDGAVMIDSSLEVLTFGSTLAAPHSSKQAFVGPDGFGRGSSATFEIGRYGTRHRSAYDFVACCPDAIAFVISQDGPVRAFRSNDENTVQVWPDCTASMFV